MFDCVILISGILIAFGQANEEAVPSKRILLTDPDVIGSRLSHMEAKLQDLQAKYMKQEATILSLQKKLTEEESKHQGLVLGSTFIHWGRTDCPGANTDVVYSGYAAGEKYSHGSASKGGASNMLCLPDNPELSNITGSSSYLYGTEFENGNFGPGALNEDVPCAFCRSLNTSSSKMFPGRYTCYPGWKEEYKGKIAASSYGHNSSPYICVDLNPTFIFGGERNNDEHLLVTTSTQCGSLQCPPYKNNMEVYCVVCSK